MSQPSTSYSFEAKIASRGYHVYKNTTWMDAKVGDEIKVEVETNKDSIKIDPYSMPVRYGLKANILMLCIQSDTSPEKYHDMYIFSSRKKEA